MNYLKSNGQCSDSVSPLHLASPFRIFELGCPHNGLSCSFFSKAFPWAVVQESLAGWKNLHLAMIYLSRKWQLDEFSSPLHRSASPRDSGSISPAANSIGYFEPGRSQNGTFDVLSYLPGYTLLYFWKYLHSAILRIFLLILDNGNRTHTAQPERMQSG